jgi:hypothetical protein
MLKLVGRIGYLPPGIHFATWNEIELLFGKGVRRQILLRNLLSVLRQLHQLGVQQVWIDGSFVTSKMRPADVDVVYLPPPNVNTSNWGPLSFAQHDILKAASLVDLWPHPSLQRKRSQPGNEPLIQWFQVDRTGNHKGIVSLFLRELNDDKEPEAANRSTEKAR